MGAQERGEGYSGKRQVEKILAQEYVDRRIATGINFAYPRDDRALDFAFNIRQRNGVFTIRSSIVDLSTHMTKGDEHDESFKSEKEKFLGDSFMPNASFGTDQDNLALTVAFTLAPDNNGTLQIANPDIFPSQLILQNVYPLHQAESLIQERNKPGINDVVSLEPYLVKHYESTAYKRTRIVSNIHRLRIFKRNMERITDEAAAQFCLQNNIPVVFRYLNPHTFVEEYTAAPPDASPHFVSLTNPLQRHVSHVNARNIIASQQDKPFPYTEAELAEYSHALNTFVNSTERHNKKSQAIQKKKDKLRLAHLSTAELEELNTARFRKAFLEGMRLLPNNAARRQLQGELAERISEGTAHVRDIYDVLFSFPPTEGGIRALQEEAIIALYQQDQYATDVLARYKGANNLMQKNSTKYKTRRREREDKKVFDTTITFAHPEGELLSDTFRSEEQKSSMRLATTNLLGKLVGIDPRTDRELQEEAGLLTDQTGRMLSEDELNEEVRRAQEERKGQNWLGQLSDLCEQYGLQIDTPEVERNPEQKYPYRSTIRVDVSGFPIVTKQSYSSRGSAISGAARSMYNIFTKPQLTESEQGIDFTQDLGALTTDHPELPPYTFEMRDTTNAQGERFVHCITSISHPEREQVLVGTATSEEEAHDIATAKLLIVYSMMVEKAQ